MYRENRDASLSSRGLFMVLPLYFYKKDEILRDLLKEDVLIMDKRITRVEAEDVKEWLVEEGRGKWPEIEDGPSLVVLAEAKNLYDKLIKVARYHNETAKRKGVDLACYASSNSIEGCRDISYFFASGGVSECMKDADSFLTQHILPVLNPALSQLAIERPKDPILWLSQRLRDFMPPS